MPFHPLKSKLRAGLGRLARSRWLPPSVSESLRQGLGLRAARKKGQQSLRAESHRLRSGLWVCEGLRLWRHWSRPIPEHLRQTKTKGIHAKSDSTSARWLYALRQYLNPWSPNPVFVRDNGSEAFPGFSIYIATRTKEGIFLDPETDRAARSAGDVPYSQEYADLRIRYSRHISAPQFQLTENGRFLLEEFVHGSHFDSLANAEQAEVLSRLFDMHGSLAREESQGSSAGIISEALDTLPKVQLPDSFLKRLNRIGATRLTKLAEGWPLTPSQCDFHAKNILVREGEPVVIDFGPTKMRWIPFFADMMEFIGRDNGRLIKDFHGGMLDAPLADLCAAARVPMREAEEMRRHFIVAYALTRPLIRSSGAVSRARYERLATEFWLNHEPYLRE